MTSLLNVNNASFALVCTLNEKEILLTQLGKCVCIPVLAIVEGLLQWTIEQYPTAVLWVKEAVFRLPSQERHSVKDLITLTPNKVLTVDSMLGPAHVSLRTILSDHHCEDPISQC